MAALFSVVYIRPNVDHCVVQQHTKCAKICFKLMVILTRAPELLVLNSIG